MTEEPSGVSAPARSFLPSVRLVATALAALVPIYLLSLIIRSSIFSRFDYFEMVPTILGPDGSVIWSGLLVHQNEHLLAVPKLVYLANIWAFAGSNVTLGIFVWLVAGGVAAVLGFALRSHLPMSGWNLPLVAWLFAVFLFPLQGQHNFRLAMSGTAWILANLLAVAAIALAVRDRPVPAAAAGGFATLTYGTGLAVWPALGLVILVRRRFGRSEVLAVVIGLASVAVQRLTAEPGRSALYDWSPISVGRSMAITLGSLFVEAAELAMLIGLGLIGLGMAALARLGPRSGQDGPLILIATMTYTLVGLALFGITRSAFGDEVFTASRYMTFAALFVLAASLLGLMAFRHSAGYGVFVAAIATASMFASTAQTQRFDAATYQADLSMLAVHMDAGVGVVPLYSEATDAAFRAVDHVPFHGGVSFGCDRYGGRLDPSFVSRGDGSGGAVTERREAVTQSAFLRPEEVATIPVSVVTGWVARSGDVECVVMVDANGRVTGIGLVDPAPGDATPGLPIGANRWTGYVEHDSPGGEVLVKLRGDDRFHVIGQIPEE